MRVRECQSPPSLVVEWLCSQLEQRGIPGPVYAQTLLSLLHSCYCCHQQFPVPQTHIPLDTHEDLPGLLELEEQLFLGECYHPDADLPLVTDYAKRSPNTTTSSKIVQVRENSSGASSDTPTAVAANESKVSALRCLLSVSNQDKDDLEVLLEELCVKLENSCKSSENYSDPSSNGDCVSNYKKQSGEVKVSQQSAKPSLLSTVARNLDAYFTSKKSDTATSLPDVSSLNSFFTSPWPFPPNNTVQDGNNETADESNFAAGNDEVRVAQTGVTSDRRVCSPECSTASDFTGQNCREDIGGASEGVLWCKASGSNYSELSTAHSNGLMSSLGSQSQYPSSKAGVTLESNCFKSSGEDGFGNYAQKQEAPTPAIDIKSAWNDSIIGSKSSEMERTGMLEWANVAHSPNVLPPGNDNPGPRFDFSSRQEHQDSQPNSSSYCSGLVDQSTGAMTTFQSDSNLGGASQYTSLPQWGSFLMPGVGGLDSVDMGNGTNRLDNQSQQRAWPNPWQTTCPEEQIDGGYVGDISSRESSQDRQDLEEVLAHDDGEEGWCSEKDTIIANSVNSTLNRFYGTDNLLDKFLHSTSQASDNPPAGLPYCASPPTEQQENRHFPPNLEYPMSNIENRNLDNQATPQSGNFGTFPVNVPVSVFSSASSLVPQENIPIQPLPKFSDEHVKNIWSDNNANSLNTQLGFPDLTGVMEPKLDAENRVCQAFENLQLERFWKDAPIGDLERQCSQSDIMGVSGDDVQNQSAMDNAWANCGITFFSEEPPTSSLIVNPTSRRAVDCPKENPSYPAALLLAQQAPGNLIPESRQVEDEVSPGAGTCGPSGVQAVLQHGHHSNFSSIVPGRTNLADLEMLKPSALSEGNSAAKENLLTSPRTHFRPITQQEVSSSSANDVVCTSPETTATAGDVADSSPLSLDYQRSNSGSLYLEKDIVEGSPKKYMVYKNPLDSNNVLEHRPLYMPVPQESTSLVPKFEVIKNEKFCQTEEVEIEDGGEGNPEDCANSQDDDSGQQQIDYQKLELDEILSQSWMRDEHQQIMHPSLFDSNVRAKCDDGRAVNSGGNYFEKSEAGWHYSKLPATAKLLMRGDSSDPAEYCSKMSDSPRQVQDRVLDTPAANAIWSSDINTNVTATSQHYNKAIMPAGLNSSIKALWADSPQIKEKAESLDSDLSSSIGSSSIPGWSMMKARDSGEIMKQIPKEWANEESISCTGMFGGKSTPEESDVQLEGSIIKIPENLSGQLFDERVWSNADGVQPIERNGSKEEKNGQALPFSAKWSEQNIWALQQQHGHRKSISADLDELLEAKRWEELVSMGDEACNDEQEDLEELDPGWRFQEGFVWDPQHDPEDSRLPRNDIDDDDDSESICSSNSSEVLIVPTEDGNTLQVPVEYFETDIYDQLFGSPDAAVSSSLPDFPSGEAGLKAAKEKWLPAWRRPCTFFMEGSCRRKHCKFSHDLSSITCRFWQEGSCLKGSECPFLHGYQVATTRRRNRSEGDTRAVSEGRGNDNASSLHRNTRGSSASTKHRHRHSSFEITSDADFPALGSASDIPKEVEKSVIVTNSANANTSVGSAQSRPQQQVKKKTKFSSVPAAESQVASNGGTSGTNDNRNRRRRHTHSAQRGQPCNEPRQQQQMATPAGDTAEDLNSNEPNNNIPDSKTNNTNKSKTRRRKSSRGTTTRCEALELELKSSRGSVHHDGTMSDY